MKWTGLGAGNRSAILDGAADLLYRQDYKREYPRPVTRIPIAAARPHGYAGPVPPPPTLPT
jgi:hypothetical protein